MVNFSFEATLPEDWEGCGYGTAAYIAEKTGQQMELAEHADSSEGERRARYHTSDIAEEIIPQFVRQLHALGFSRVEDIRG